MTQRIVVSNFERIADLKPLRRDDALVAFTGLDESTNLPIELRLVPEQWLAGDNIDRFVRRLQLIKLIKHPSIRCVLAQQIEPPPGKLKLEAPLESLATDLVGTNDALNVWDVSRQLIDAIDTCHRFGLAIGENGFRQIRINSAGTIQLDPMLTLSTDVDGDLRFLAQTLASWFSVAAREENGSTPPSKATLLPARNRAAIQQRLRQAAADTRSQPATVDEWRSLFVAPVLSPEIDSAVFETLPALTVELPSIAVDQTAEMAPVAIASDVTAEISKPMPSLSPLETPTAEDSSNRTASVALATKAESASEAGARAGTCNVGDSLGRFRLDRMIGRGGMGVVFAATDVASGEAVAIKVLRMESGDLAQAVRRFRKEARLLGDIQNDHVTRLVEVGLDRGHHYMAMELVEGTNLQRWLGKNASLEPEAALRLVADIARGLVDAHASGIIHRDIKPENILLQHKASSATTTTVHDESTTPIDQYQVKVTDFGIARYVHQNESMEVTRAGALLGTPLYMSPEQCKGSATITPAADVYALGITLYQLLTGSPPFSATDAMKLAAMHCFDPPPSVQRRNPAVTDPIAQIIARALAKNPEERYADASQLLAAISRVLSGKPSDIQLHPQYPASAVGAAVERRYQWELKSSANELWHFVANTERLNRAIGLQPVEWDTRHDPQLGMRRFGSFKVAGMRVQWEEHPFEWIEGSRMGVLREFTSGPLEVFASVVELHPLESGGTKLTHTLRITPRGTLGRLLIKVEIDRKSERNLDDVYRRIDESIQARAAAARASRPASLSDPFERKVPVTAQQRQRINERCERLISRGVTPTVATRLQEFLLLSSPQTLSQIRPLALAEELSIESDSVINACLIAATEGLLTLMWDILCPTCRVAAVTVDALSEINAHTRCEACDVDFQSNISDAIEMVFRAHPEIRDVDTASYCIGGPSHSPHVVAQVRMAPHERLELELALAPGDYVLRGPRLTRQQTLRVRSENAPSEHEVLVGEFGLTSHTPLLRAGRQTVVLTNDDSTTQMIRLERQVSRDNVVTATVASTMPRFRELFPNQTFDRDTPIVSDDITLLTSGIASIETLYRQQGDAEAYRVIRKLVELQTEIIVARGGTVAKSVGEGLLAAFRKCDEAVAAAIEIQHRAANDASLAFVHVCVGLHRGQVLITTQNDRLDYFGSTARLAQILPSLGGKISMTDRVFADPAIQLRFANELQRATTRSVDVPGHGTQLLLSFEPELTKPE